MGGCPEIDIKRLAWCLKWNKKRQRINGLPDWSGAAEVKWWHPNNPNVDCSTHIEAIDIAMRADDDMDT